MASLRTIIKTYEPDGVFNHYCVQCGGKNHCVCHDDSDPICGCGELAYACRCDQLPDQVQDLDLILSAIATETSSKIQDNINIDCWRYLIVKNQRGIPTRIDGDELVVNNIKYKLSDPTVFQNLNELLDLSQSDLITRFLTTNMWGVSVLSPQPLTASGSQFMLVYPNPLVNPSFPFVTGHISEQTRDCDRKKFDGIILSGKCVGYNVNLNRDVRTQEVPYP